MTPEDIKNFLIRKGWTVSYPSEGMIRYTSPGSMRIEPAITFDFPATDDQVYFERYLPRVLETLAQLYELPVLEIEHLVRPMINCNVQVYRTEHIPPHLFKGIIPFPFYFYFSIFYYAEFYRLYFKFSNFTKYSRKVQKLITDLKRFRLWWFRHFRILKPIFVLWLWIQTYFLFIDPYLPFQLPSDVKLWVLTFFKPLRITHEKLIILLLLLISFYQVPKLILVFSWWFATQLIHLTSKPFQKVSAFLYNTGKFSFIRNQEYLLRVLTGQYPEATGFVVHTIDLDFMQAGKPHILYQDQLKELSALIIKKSLGASIFPLLFIDPRRMKNDASFFQFNIIEGSVVLLDCVVKRYFEGGDVRFNGFKLNPAMGYYPFDENLLPLWKYAADNNLPVYVNCNRDALYYRGDKQKEWDYHPFFGEMIGNDPGGGYSNYGPLLLPQLRNSEFTQNFLNPLNYLCLLHEPLLRKVVSNTRNAAIRALFGFTNSDTPLRYNLTNIKLCFSHFGGAEEWQRFMKYDTAQPLNNALLRKPNEGIHFFISKGNEHDARIGHIWKTVDWYSIIASIILQYPNVYADISHIPNNLQLYALFKKTLQNPKLRSKILLGTDFYMIHRHKTERSILAALTEYLTPEEIELIAKENPRRYLGIL